MYLFFIFFLPVGTTEEENENHGLLMNFILMREYNNLCLKKSENYCHKMTDDLRFGCQRTILVIYMVSSEISGLRPPLQRWKTEI